MTRNLFIAGYSVSVFGSGLVYPLVVLFLTNVLNVSATAASFYFALTGISSMAAGLLSSYLVNKISFLNILRIGVALQTVAGIALAFSPTIYWSYASGIALGLGNGFFFAIQTMLFIRLFGKDGLGEVFSLQLVVMNIAVAISGICGGLLVEAIGDVGYRIAFIFNGISFVFYGCILEVLSRRAQPESAAESESETNDSPKTSRRVAINVIVRILIMQFLVSATAFSQMDTVYPVSITRIPHFTVLYVSSFLVINGIAVVILQKVGLSICKLLGNARTMSLASAVWATVFAISWLGFSFDHEFWISISVFIFVAVGFAFAEVLEAPAFQPLIVETVPSESLGSVTSLTSTAYSLGLFIGPLLTLPLIDFEGGHYAWFLLVASQVVLLVISLSFQHASKSSAILSHRN